MARLPWGLARVRRRLDRPLGAAAATGLALLMSGAVALRIRVRDSAGFVLGDTLFLVAAIVTAVLRVRTA